MAEKEPYATLKDHKDDFRTKLPCRLINPAKSEIGKMSQVMLERYNFVIFLLSLLVLPPPPLLLLTSACPYLRYPPAVFQWPTSRTRIESGPKYPSILLL